MPIETKGRRVPIVNHGTKPSQFFGEFPILEQAGDYAGPVRGFTGDSLAVFYLLPTARDEGVDRRARSVHHIVIPPHKLFEEPDGSLTIRESIGADPYWHGFLNAGKWELSRQPTAACPK